MEWTTPHTGSAVAATAQTSRMGRSPLHRARALGRARCEPRDVVARYAARLAKQPRRAAGGRRTDHRPRRGLPAPCADPAAQSARSVRAVGGHRDAHAVASRLRGGSADRGSDPRRPHPGRLLHTGQSSARRRADAAHGRVRGHDQRRRRGVHPGRGQPARNPRDPHCSAVRVVAVSAPVQLSGAAARVWTPVCQWTTVVPARASPRLLGCPLRGGAGGPGLGAAGRATVAESTTPLPGRRCGPRGSGHDLDLSVRPQPAPRRPSRTVFPVAFPDRRAVAAGPPVLACPRRPTVGGFG